VGAAAAAGRTADAAALIVPAACLALSRWCCAGRCTWLVMEESCEEGGRVVGVDVMGAQTRVGREKNEGGASRERAVEAVGCRVWYKERRSCQSRVG
jgi:hypothetical protein